MRQPDQPENEELRIQALRSLEILDTPFDEGYDRVTRLAQWMFSVPIALVSLVDTNRQWFKSCIGLPVRETGRDISFCGHAILDDQPFIINDAAEDERFFDNPLVTHAPFIRFYAGRPLKTLDGTKIGTLCIIDQIPRTFSESDIHKLHDLAAIVEKEIHNRELAFQVKKTQTDLIQAKEKAEYANHEKSRFLANMSHELRTPMHSIISFSSIGEKKTPEEKAKKYFSNINQSGKRLLDLINNLLDISKLESGKMEAQFSEYNVFDIAQSQLELLEPLSNKKHIPVIIEGDDKAFVTCDKKLISQVFINLISNAIKYSPENTRITISIEKKKLVHKGKFTECVYCAVKDEGRGIPVDQLDLIFDRFFESSYTRKKSGGTGLGLSICKEIIKLHDGLIWVTSPLENQDIGSEFHFRFPVEQDKSLTQKRFDSGPGSIY